MSYTDIHYYLHYQSLGTAAYKDDGTWNKVPKRCFYPWKFIVYDN